MAESEEGVDKARLKQPASVLFVCAMNAIRSPMAEYLTRLQPQRTEGPR